VEYYGNLSFLKAGLYYADHITTVSPSYAEEIQTEALGFGMQGLLTHRRGVLSGILNGVDYAEWNPLRDGKLARGYSAADLSGKATNKAALQARMGLRADPEIPLFGMVSRFTYQKGLDLVLEVAPQLLDLPAQLVLLGSGEAGLQQAALELSHRHPMQVAAYVGFNEELSHLIEAGADAFLMPSRFEPCGLNQMYSQRYGTVPVVRRTGGLADSVEHYDPATGEGTGVVFNDFDPPALEWALNLALDLYAQPSHWSRLLRNGMARDFSWTHQGGEYLALYRRLTQT